MYAIKMFEDMGRGLVATNLIPRGSVVTVCELLVLSERDTDAVNATDLKFYLFKFNDNQDCLVLGDGELFNHAPEANVGYRLMERKGRDVMEYVALRDIAEGEQLFINYSADVSVDVTEYLKTGSLVR